MESRLNKGLDLVLILIFFMRVCYSTENIKKKVQESYWSPSRTNSDLVYGARREIRAGGVQAGVDGGR